ncbi:DNA polymerase III subunit chi [Sphingomonas sp. RP10(2022)]|uniref:DNA polymerase III subunit chi n=1 Tax=Sphingomonas liriopis TaxID=2949094 RepID=A0A9X2HU98_9SPHN|nr:DNA polymerase III subunit chi [Sphingomonas liriopis]MCP3733608.1 DNA polymerase III subunit chi [Sphingomonas liriopis]
MQVDFYHLTATPLDRALPQIAAKVVDSGARLLIVSGKEDQRVDLDRLLWTYKTDSFLPHAQAGAGDDSLQPILLAGEITQANAARHIALVDGEWRDGALAFDRTFHFFEDEHIRPARDAWRALGSRDGVERRYWKQTDTGRWEQAA